MVGMADKADGTVIFAFFLLLRCCPVESIVV